MPKLFSKTPEPSQNQFYVQELWDYHQMHHKINVQTDCIIGLGSYDLDVVNRCVELYFQNVASRLLFTGKFGNWTHGLWKKTDERLGGYNQSHRS